MRAPAAGALEAQLYIGAFNADDFEVATVGLEHGTNLFKFGFDLLIHDTVSANALVFNRKTRDTVTGDGQ